MYVCKIKSVIYKSGVAVALHHVPDVSLSLQNHKQTPYTSYLNDNQKSKFFLLEVSLVETLFLLSLFY